MCMGVYVCMYECMHGCIDVCMYVHACQMVVNNTHDGSHPACCFVSTYVLLLLLLLGVGRTGVVLHPMNLLPGFPWHRAAELLNRSPIA